MWDRLPIWLSMRNITPVRYYRYTSFVSDKLLEFEQKDAPEFFNELKERVMNRDIDISEAQDGSDVRTKVWDNKVVIECLTGNGNTLFVGYYDWKVCVGLGRWGDSWVKPYKILNS